MELNSELHTPAALFPSHNQGMFLIRGWVGPRAGLDMLKKWKIFFPYRGSNLGFSNT
jgi:hypothetical protein